MFYVIHQGEFSTVTRECDSRDVALAVATAIMTSILMNARSFKIHEEFHVATHTKVSITNFFITEL